MSAEPVKGHAEVIAALNEALAGELRAINQYMIHSKLLESWGFAKRAAAERKQAIDEMHHADRLMDRIALLEGEIVLPSVGALALGANLREAIASDLELELTGIAHYRKAAALAEQHGDLVSRDLFASILAEEEKHQDEGKTELELIERIGLENFSALQV